MENFKHKQITITASIGSSLHASELSRALKVSTEVVTYQTGKNVNLPKDEKAIIDFFVFNWQVQLATDDEGNPYESGVPKNGIVQYIFDITAECKFKTNLTDEEIKKHLSIDFCDGADMREIDNLFDSIDVEIEYDE